jgi:hypothetical protein
MISLTGITMKTKFLVAATIIGGSLLLSIPAVAQTRAKAASRPSATGIALAKVPEVKAEEQKIQLDVAELPHPIKQLLGGEYKDWSLARSYLVKSEPAYYGIELVRNDDKVFLKLDAGGKRIEDKKQD